MKREFMPILRNPDFRLPWALIEPHAAQAMKNHGQTLERLAERGGLGFSEALAIMCDLDWRRIGKYGGEDGCRQSLETLIAKRSAAVIQNTAVDERMAAQNSESVDGYVQGNGGVKAVPATDIAGCYVCGRGAWEACKRPAGCHRHVGVKVLQDGQQ